MERGKRIMCGGLTESAFVCSKMASSGTMKLAMERMGVACSLHELPEPTPLCKHHYRIIHSILQPPQTNCSTCNISLRHCNSRPCPQPEVIQQHLRENTGFEGHVKAQDKVCYTCYKCNFLNLQQNKMISRDSDLQKLITTCRQLIPLAESIWSQDDMIISAVANTVVLVGSELV